MQLLVITWYYQQLHLKYLRNLARHWLQAPWGLHDSVETCRSVIICEIIVHLLVILKNEKKNTTNYFSGGNTAKAWNWTHADRQFKNTRKYIFTDQYESQRFKHKSV